MTHHLTTPSSLLRRSLLLLATGLPVLVATGAVHAQTWPDKIIKLVVPFPAGGPTDTAARIIGEKLSEGLKQQVIIDNRSGASGTIGAASVAKAPADGYTIMMLATPTLLAPHMYAVKGYDLFKDFVPIATAYELPIVLVVNAASMPDVTNLQQLLAKAKAQPGQINYTSSGKGSYGHLSTEMMKSLGGFEMQHVPYRGSAPAVADVLGGQVPVMFADLVSVLPHIKSGKLRAIAIGSLQRLPALPAVKTVAEQGFPGYDAVSWGGMAAPAGTPKEVVARLSDEMRRVLADKDVIQRMEVAGAYAHYQAPDELSKRMRRDFDVWGKLIRDRNISAD